MFIQPRYIILFVCIIILYGIASIFSNGFHHPDEHFQLIEFAGLKMGWNSGEDLTWEYDSQIRPTIQIYIVMIVFKLCNLLEIHDPFALSFALRICSLIVYLASTLFFIQSFKNTVLEKYRFVWLLMTFFFWFLPIINVRFSSEVWSGFFLLTSVAMIQLNRLDKPFLFLIGIVFGCCFELRFQMGIPITGILLWLLIIKKIEFGDILVIVGGLFGVIVLATLLDSIFYGEFVFAPYNYFKVDLIDNVVNTYGVHPWYYYLLRIMEGPTLFIGIPILASTLYLLMFNPKNVILWAILPYLLIHSLIPHKETRYLFPIVNFIPIIVIWAYQDIIQRDFIKKNAAFAIKTYILFLVPINIMGLLMVFKPAGNGAANLAKIIHDKYVKEALIVYSPAIGPFSIGNGKGHTAKFYIDEKITLRFIDEGLFPDLPDSNNVVVIPKGFFAQRQLIEEAGYRIEEFSIPRWISFLNKFYRVFNEKDVVLLYRRGE